MCQECGHMYCVEACPNYTGRHSQWGRLRGSCHRCRKNLFWEDVFFVYRNRLYCGDCYRQAKRCASMGKSFLWEKA